MFLWGLLVGFFFPSKRKFLILVPRPFSRGINLRDNFKLLGLDYTKFCCFLLHYQLSRLNSLFNVEILHIEINIVQEY